MEKPKSSHGTMGYGMLMVRRYHVELAKLANRRWTKGRREEEAARRASQHAWLMWACHEVGPMLPKRSAAITADGIGYADFDPSDTAHQIIRVIRRRKKDVESV